MSEPRLIRCPWCGATNRVPQEKLDQGLAPVCGRCKAPLPVGGKPVTVGDATLELFRGYDWPGNVRELENMMRRIAVLGSDEQVAEELRARNAARATITFATVPRPSDGEARGRKEILRAAAREAERTVLLAALERFRWNRLRASELLGISYRSVLYKIADYHLQPPDRSTNSEGSVA